MTRNHAILTVGLAIGASSLLGGCLSPRYVQGDTSPVSENGQPEYGLDVGERAPDATLTAADGRTVTLASLYSEGPLVVAFYRGGWCPYCNSALTEWQDRLHDLDAAGGRMIALTPEKPSKVEDTIDDNKLGFDVYSDAKFEAADGFRIRDTLGLGAKAKYAAIGVNVGGWNASDTWELPHPATFIVDTDGIVRYRHVDPDYTVRADPEQVIEVVSTITGRGG